MNYSICIYKKGIVGRENNVWSFGWVAQGLLENRIRLVMVTTIIFWKFYEEDA